MAALSNGGQLLLPNLQFEFFIDWFYSVDLGLSKVLSGDLSAYVKLKALFFSKTFLTFGDPFNLSMSVRLIEGGSRLGGITLPVPGIAANSLGTFEMQLPFVDLQPLPQVSPAPTPSAIIADIPAEKQLQFEEPCNTKQPGESRAKLSRVIA